ncbi:Leucyl-tRNA synthetase [Aphelenchoides fujianensis]|nr:Leucyl-tRNA synthetase [Aphelenchoides fujianensis]
MFPYPSGRLHLGHMRVYSISDVLARYYRLNGFNVFHPIGWDAFGLPAENAARSMGVRAADWTRQNIADMREQLRRTGVQFDWDAELSTCDPDFYRWTQWIFGRLHQEGLTVLAAEQIDADGRSWRSGAPVEKRKLRQWAVETPKYAKQLLDGLHDLRADWREVADIQANWIGKCDAFRFILPVQGGEHEGETLDLRLLDPTELGRAEFVLLHSEHPLVDDEPKGRHAASVWTCSRKRFSKGRSKRVRAATKRAERSPTGWSPDNASGALRSRWSWTAEESRVFPLEQLPLLPERRGEQFEGGRIETDTLDTFFDSSWYFLRFLDPHNSKALADPAKLREFMPVDVYVGGIEHADVHLMSKSKANGVDPLEVIDEVGVDLTRLQLLAAAAPRAHLNWGESDLKGLRKWIERMEWVVDAYVRQRRSLAAQPAVERVTPQREEFFRENFNYFVRNVSICLEVLNVHNTAIARLQGLTNTLRKIDPEEAGRSVELERCIHALVVMLQVRVRPETAEKFWSKLVEVKPLSSGVRKEDAPLSAQRWPQVDDDAVTDFSVSMLDTSCSRASVPRPEVEPLGDAELVELAKREHHSAFFKLLDEHKVHIEKLVINRRPGLHVNIDITAPPSVDMPALRKILEQLAQQKTKDRKSAKKKRLEESRKK